MEPPVNEDMTNEVRKSARGGTISMSNADASWKDARG
jgi:hypothetical protein